MRNQKNTYCFIYNSSGKYYKAVQHLDGNYSITKDSQPYPISFSPINLDQVPFEFGTNETYFSLNRSIVDPLKFIKDGAAILRYAYHTLKGTEEKIYLTVTDWDGSTGKYMLSYNGRIDLLEKLEDPKTGMFTVPVVDNSAWGVLSQNDETEYAIECNEKNPKAIRVLFDGILLKNRYTYQTVQSAITYIGLDTPYSQYAMPFILINQDGDSSGIIVKGQNGNSITDSPPNDNTLGWFMSSIYDIQGVNIEGTIEFLWNGEQDPLDTTFATGIEIIFKSNFQTIGVAFGRGYPGPGVLQDGKIYKSRFNYTFDMKVGENIFLLLQWHQPYASSKRFTVTPITTNITITVKTKPQPIVAYGLRPLDLLQQIVSKATNGKYSIGSEFFVENNKDISIPGDSLRQIPNAKIYTNLRSFFKTFDAIYYMAFRSILDKLWMEKTTEVYKQDSILLDIGEAIDFQLEPAKGYLANSIDIGSPDVDLRHPSGRLEYNTLDSYSLPMYNVKKKLEVVTEYHTGCFEMQFLIMDYMNESTKDNSGDKKMFLVKITDEMGMATEDIQTFENVTVDDAPLNPFIKYPLDNDVIPYNKPRVRGIAKPGDNVNIYVDSVLDGGTVADGNGNWDYEISTALSEFIDGVQTGAHVIQATFTDDIAPTDTKNIQINIDNPSVTEISYPEQSSNLYNNKPLITGYAQKGQNVDISLDGIVIGSVVADSDCRWEFKITVPFSNGSHVLSINAGTDTVNFAVDSAVLYPLITYIGSELDGIPLINNLPLIQGVALPNIQVDLYLNYISNVKLGTAFSDVNGNWSFQVVPLTYLDPVSGVPVVVAPIQNGLDIISTSLTNHNVGIVVTGYLLSKPNYSSITGVLDNSVFNTEYRPEIMLENRYPLLSSILAKQSMEYIQFQKSTKNGELRTVLDGVVRAENQRIPVSSLGSPLFLLETAIIKTRTNKKFASLLRDFNKGGIIKTSFRGTDLYCLPIGTMKMNSLHSDVQEWKLLMSPQTTYFDLLNLYKNGVLIKLNKNSMFHSDYNTLHFVKYGYTLPDNYKIKDLYDDWFCNRNDQWVYNPKYTQKLEREKIKDQIITKGTSSIILRIYRCFDASIIDTIPYSPLNPSPLLNGEVVMEAEINWNSYPDDIYFCVWFVGETPVGISEKIETRSSWPGTIKIVAYSSTNQVGMFYSSGIRTIIRVEGMIEKLQSEVEISQATDQNHNTENIYGTIGRKRDIRFGTAYGMPDYLYLKIGCAIILDNINIENVDYSSKESNKLEPSEDYGGHPLYYYVCSFDLKYNPLGLTIDTPDQNGRHGVVLIMDAEAVGLPPDRVVRIELNNE